MNRGEVVKTVSVAAAAVAVTVLIHETGHFLSTTQPLAGYGFRLSNRYGFLHPEVYLYFSPAPATDLRMALTYSFGPALGSMYSFATALRWRRIGATCLAINIVGSFTDLYMATTLLTTAAAVAP